MIYFAAKFLEACGLGLLGYVFLRTFPDKMNYKIFAASGLLFICGWIIERYLLKK